VEFNPRKLRPHLKCFKIYKILVFPFKMWQLRLWTTWVDSFAEMLALWPYSCSTVGIPEHSRFGNVCLIKRSKVSQFRHLRDQRVRASNGGGMKENPFLICASSCIYSDTYLEACIQRNNCGNCCVFQVEVAKKSTCQ